MFKINVLQLVEGFNFGGAETKLLELVRHMDRDRFATTVISLGLGNEIEDKFHQLDCPVMTFQRRNKIDLSLLGRLTEFITKQKIDIVMSTLFYADILGALAAHRGGAKAMFAWETISSPKWLVPHRFVAYHFVLRHIDRVISVSHATATWLREKRKVPAKKIIVIPYGVDLDRFQSSRKSLTRESIGVKPDDVLIGQVSRLNEQKGHKYLVEAAFKIVKHIPNARFVLVGDGPLRGDIEDQIKRLDLSKHFILLGFRQDVPDILALLDYFVLPSLYEGLPNVILEAMAARLPIIATPVDGTKEAILDGESGILVPAGNVNALVEKLCQLNSNPTVAAQLGENARKRVESHFSLGKQVTDFENLYEHFARQ